MWGILEDEIGIADAIRSWHLHVDVQQFHHLTRRASCHFVRATLGWSNFRRALISRIVVVGMPSLS